MIRYVLYVLDYFKKKLEISLSRLTFIFSVLMTIKEFYFFLCFSKLLFVLLDDTTEANDQYD